jgi:hypothetical protein
VTIKDVQKLMVCLAVLSPFISGLAEWALSFFKLLWKSGPFVWTEEVEEAFQELKWYLTSPPIMVAREPGEPLQLYIMTIVDAVSKVLVVEQLEPCQHQEPEAKEAPGTQRQEAHPAPKLYGGANTVIEPKLPEVDLGPINQEATGSQLPGPHSDSRGQEPLEPEPMEVDAPDPLGGSKPSSDMCTISVKSSTMPR